MCVYEYERLVVSPGPIYAVYLRRVFIFLNRFYYYYLKYHYWNDINSGSDVFREEISVIRDW